MSDQNKPTEQQAAGQELGDEELGKIAGGLLSEPTKSTESEIGAPKKAFAEKLGSIAQGVTQVGLDVAAN